MSTNTTIPIVVFPDIQPWEKLPYVFDVTDAIPQTETIDSVAFAIYNEDDDDSSPTDLASTMLRASDFTTPTLIEADVQAATKNITYRIRGRITCSSGNGYEVEGRFRCVER